MRLTIDTTTYGALVDQLKAARVDALAIRSRAGDECAAAIDKALGLTGLIRIERAPSVTDDQGDGRDCFGLRTSDDPTDRGLTAARDSTSLATVYAQMEAADRAYNRALAATIPQRDVVR